MRTLVASVLVLGFGLAATAHASVVLGQSVEQLTQNSDLVVRAHVTSQSSAWTRSGRILTTVHLVVDRSLKGQAGATVDVRHLGGHVGDIGQQVEGEVGFSDGEEVVVFLHARRSMPGLYAVVGMSQGKFHLDRSATAVVARQKLEGLGVIAKPGAAIEDRAGEAIPLEKLEQRVVRAASP